MLKEIFNISAFPSLLSAEKRPLWDKALIVFKTYGLIFLSMIAVGIIITATDHLVINVLHHKSIRQQYDLQFDKYIKKIGYPLALTYICLLGPALEEIVFRLSLSFKKTPLAISIAVAIFMFGGIFPFVKNLTANVGVGYALAIRAAFSALIYFALVKLLPGNRSFNPIFKKTIIIISMVVFGLMHIGNFGPLQWNIIWIYPVYVLPQLMMGWGITYVRFKNGFIWGIALHCLINSMSMLVFREMAKEVKVKQGREASSKTADTTNSKNIDTTKSFKIGSTWIKPKSSFQFNAVDHISKDTIALVTCADYAYSPFGDIKDSKFLKKSLLNNFIITNKIDKSTNAGVVVQSLKLGSSKLLLFFDHDPEASRGSYIIKGEIYDTDAHFSQHIRIGMPYGDFCKTFFENFPVGLQKKYHVIALESCIEGTRHIYTFKDEKLNSVKFECIKCSWTVDY